MKPTNIQIGSKIWVKSPISHNYFKAGKLILGTIFEIFKDNFTFTFKVPEITDNEQFACFKNSSHLNDLDWLYPTANDLIQKQKELGAFFSIWFIKKDGTERKMNCRFGVKKHLHGGKATVSEDKYWIVWDTVAKDYRAVNKETIFRIKCKGVVYEND